MSSMTSRSFVAPLLAIVALTAATARPVRAQTTGTTPPQTPAPAQTPAPPPGPPLPKVEFDAAIARAIDQNPTVKQAATAIARAEALLDQARAVTRPTASATASDVTVSNSAVIEGIVTVPRNQVSLSGDVTMAVLSPARWAQIAQAKDEVGVANDSTADVRRQIAVAAGQAYLAVFAARRQVDVQQRALTNSEAHLDYAQKRFQGGVGSRVDQVRAAQVASSDQSILENTQFALLRAQEALGVLLASDSPMDVGGEPVFDVPSSVDIDQSLASRTDIKLETSTEKAAERVFHDSGKDWWPTGSLSFDPSYVTPASIFQTSKSWRLTLTFTQPLLDGGLRRAQAREREVAVDSAKLAIDVTTIQAKSDIRLAQESIASSQRALQSARLAAQQAAEVLQITTTAFEVGATTNLEVIDAERTARDADTTAAVAEDALREARLSLLVALGRFPK